MVDLGAGTASRNKTTSPARLVARDDAVAAVRDLLTDPAGGPVVGLVGMAGTGTSTLARAVVHDPAVAQAFPAGIVWVDVHPNPDVTAVVSAVLAAFGDVAPVFDLAKCSERLGRLLAGAACLVVLDNVGVDGGGSGSSGSVLRALPLSGRARLLVTTRSRDALGSDSAAYEVGTVEPQTARKVLACHAGCPVESLPAEADAVVASCGGLVLALALAGGMAAENLPWAEVAERVRQADRGRDRLARPFAGHPHPHLLAALDAAVTALPAEAAERFGELAVFEGRGPVPASVVARLWRATTGMAESDAGDLLRMFARRSLVQVDPETDVVTVHDLLFDYARSGLGSSRLAELHALLADDLLGRWGGVDRRLVALENLENTAELDDADRYGIGVLIAHLLAAGRRDLVDAVLAVEWPTRTGRVHNAWCTVHENLGRINDYLADIRAVWADAEAETDRALATGGEAGAEAAARGVGREIGCAFVMASLASITADIPPAILLRAVAEGVWPPRRALTYALAIPDPGFRAQALAGLAAHLPADERVPLLARAVEAACAVSIISAPSAWAKALRRLAPYLPADEYGPLLARAVDAATAVTVDPSFHAWALGTLAPHLSDDERGPLLARALESAVAIREPAAQAQALEDLAPYLPPTLVDRAVEAATTINAAYFQARVLGALLPRLPADKLGPLLAQAVKAATTAIPFDYAWALENLVPYLTADKLGPLLAQAVHTATTIRDPAERVQALRDLAPSLPAYKRGPLLAQAVDTATTIGDPAERVRALGELAPYLPADERDPLFAQAAKAATTIGDPASQAWALRYLASRLPADERGPLLGQALEVAAAIGDPAARVRVLRDLAPNLRPVLPRLRARVVEVVAATSDPAARVQAVWALAAHLPADERGPLLSVVAKTAPAIGDPYFRAQALAFLAAHLPADERVPLLAQAVEATTTIDNSNFRALALGNVARQLPRALLARAVEIAADIDHWTFRAHALGYLTPYLPADEGEPLFTRVLEAAITIETPSSRARAVTDIASAEGKDRETGRPRSWRTALRAAAQVDRRSVVEVLPAVLPHAPSTTVRQATNRLVQVHRWWP